MYVKLKYDFQKISQNYDIRYRLFYNFSELKKNFPEFKKRFWIFGKFLLLHFSQVLFRVRPGHKHILYQFTKKIFHNFLNVSLNFSWSYREVSNFSIKFTENISEFCRTPIRTYLKSRLHSDRFTFYRNVSHLRKTTSNYAHNLPKFSQTFLKISLKFLWNFTFY